jgi:hypothetical protein
MLSTRLFFRYPFYFFVSHTAFLFVTVSISSAFLLTYLLFDKIGLGGASAHSVRNPFASNTFHTFFLSFIRFLLLLFSLFSLFFLRGAFPFLHSMLHCFHLLIPLLSPHLLLLLRFLHFLLSNPMFRPFLPLVSTTLFPHLGVFKEFQDVLYCFSVGE